MLTTSSVIWMQVLQDSNKVNRVLLAGLIAAIVALLNIAPFAMIDPGPDVQLHYSFIRCFADAFWRGEGYTRWCMAANTELGAPAFLIYFPLTYLVTALVYPLTYMGISIMDLVYVGFYLNALFTIFTTWYWLKHIVSSKVAFFAACLFLFAPYRAELLYTRSGYAELWCLSLAPLLLLYSRFLLQRQKGAWLKLGSVMAIAIITHVPQAIILTLLCGLYVLILGKGQWQYIKKLMAAAVLAVALSAFQWMPTMHYHHYINSESLTIITQSWVSRAYVFDKTKSASLVLLMLNAIFTCLLIVLLGVQLSKKKEQITNRLCQMEIILLPILSITALAFAMGALPSFWSFSYLLQTLISPWRMLSVMSLVLIYLLAIRIHWRITSAKDGTIRFETAMMTFMIMLLSIIPTTKWDTATVGIEQSIRTHFFSFNEYYSQWTRKDVRSLESMMARLDKKPPFTTIISGDAKLKAIMQGNYFNVESESKKGARVRIDHFYFPVWKARDEAGNVLALQAEQGSGRMLLDVPAGKHNIQITQSIFHDRPWLIWTSQLVSLFTGLATLCAFRPVRRF
ncbi:MAG: hypothetical protein SFT92_04820 [Rickettsiales bacterium]|nr:hypothetical protein [Rickettsiales bacterium]